MSSGPIVNPTRRHQGLTTEMRLVWAVAWPLVLTNMLNVAVGIVDLKMVGVLGVVPIAAVGMSRQVMMFLMVLMIAVSGGSSILIARAHGAKDRQQVSTIAARAMACMCWASVIIVMPLGLFASRYLLLALGATPEVVRLGCGYLHILFLGSLFTMFNFAVTGVLLGVGRTKVSLVLLIGVNLLNIGLNYVLIFGMGPIRPMGVSGAALGTILSRAVGSIAGLWIVATPRFAIQATFRDACVLDLPLLRRILYLGGPRSLQGIVRNFSRLMTLRIITLLPAATEGISAYSVAMQVRMVSTFVGLAFMSAAMTRVGQNMGARKPREAARSGWLAAAMATILMTLVSAFYLLFPEAIMSFFTGDADVIAKGRIFFIITALTEPVMAFSFALSGGLRGGGDPVSPFIYGSVSDLVVVIAVGYLCAVPLGMGFTGIAVGMALSAVTRAIPTMLTFSRGRWKHITV